MEISFKLEEVQMSPSPFYRIVNTTICNLALWAIEFAPSFKINPDIKLLLLGIEL
jgi:hypothetical protein